MFAKRFKDLRETNNLQQKEVAQALNIPASTISKWEHEERTPYGDMLIKISKYFNVTIDYLLGNDEVNNIKSEMMEMKHLQRLLIKNKFIQKDEDFTKNDLDYLMKFIYTNKEFIKNKSSNNKVKPKW